MISQLNLEFLVNPIIVVVYILPAAYHHYGFGVNVGIALPIMTVSTGCSIIVFVRDTSSEPTNSCQNDLQNEKLV